MSGAFEISVFGAFQLLNESGEPVTFPARTASAVPAYLALAKGKWTPRKEMALAMWPDQDGPAAMVNLRTAIHRVKKTLGHDRLIEQRDTSMRLAPIGVSTDIERADRLHRAYLFASSDKAGVAALRDEWELRKAGVLVGWDYEWLESFRVASEFATSDIGVDLARSYEGIGEGEAALEIWRSLLDRNPYHVEALKSALRLEYAINGREKALVLADQGSQAFGGIEVPTELAKAIQSIRSGTIRHLPKPEMLRTRSEILLLASMFESSLKSNRTEALALLARECASPIAQHHPRTTLSLLTLALTKTEGVNPERIHLASQTAGFASLASEFDIGHYWSDFVIDHADPGSQEYGDALSIKGFMCFEQRRYEEAFEYLEQALEAFQEQGREELRLRALSRMAGVQWHLLRFDEAIRSYKLLLSACDEHDEEGYSPLRTVAHGNLCFVHAVRQEWEQAKIHGEACQQYLEGGGSYRAVTPIPHGLALFMIGERSKGREMLIMATRATCREGMYRFNQIAVDFSGIALYLDGHTEQAKLLFHANGMHRLALRHFRSPAESDLITATTGLDLAQGIGSRCSQLDGQPATVLTEWVCEQLGNGEP